MADTNISMDEFATSEEKGTTNGNNTQGVSNMFGAMGQNVQTGFTPGFSQTDKVDTNIGSIINDSLGIFLNSSTKDDNAVFEEIKEKIEEITKQYLEASKILSSTFSYKVIPISRNNGIYGTLAYSTIVVYASYKDQTNGSNGVAIPFMIARTGNEATTVEQFVNTNIENINRGGNDRILYETFTAAIDNDFYQIINKHLEHHSGGGKIDYLSAVIVTNSLTDQKSEVKVHSLGETIADIATSAISTALIVNTDQGVVSESGKLLKMSDLNISEFTGAMENAGTQNNNGNKRNVQYKLTHHFTQPYGKLVQDVDSVGFETRKDFTLSLEVHDNTSKQTKSLNRLNTNQILTKTSGFIEAIPNEVHEQDKLNPNNVVTTIKFIPQIVLTKANGIRPTVGYKLLSIAVTGAVLQQHNYMHVLFNNLNSPTNTPKGLNSILPDGNSKINLDDKSLSHDTIKAYLAELFREDPVISYDACDYGESSFVDTSFLLAAGGDAKAYARIIKAAVELTDGHFPSNYTDPIFIPELCTLIPMGYYFNKESQSFRDIRDVDFAYLCNSNKIDNDAKFHWYMSTFNQQQTLNLGDRKGIVDSYEMKVHLLNKAGLSGASIIGNATRVTFSANFISLLIESLIASGFNFTTSLTNIGTSNNFTGFGQTRNMFTGAQINNASNRFNSFSHNNFNRTGGGYNNERYFNFRG